MKSTGSWRNWKCLLSRPDPRNPGGLRAAHHISQVPLVSGVLEVEVRVEHAAR